MSFMKMRVILFILMLSCARELSAQATQPFLHEFRKGKSILYYSYMQRYDSTFLIGSLKERASGQSVLDVNITVKGFPIGTVPDTTGNFKIRLRLPVKELHHCCEGLFTRQANPPALSGR